MYIPTPFGIPDNTQGLTSIEALYPTEKEEVCNICYSNLKGKIIYLNCNNTEIQDINISLRITKNLKHKHTKSIKIIEEIIQENIDQLKKIENRKQHVFCQKCILKWLSKKLTCPICRVEVDPPPFRHPNKNVIKYIIRWQNNVIHKDGLHIYGSNTDNIPQDYTIEDILNLSLKNYCKLFKTNIDNLDIMPYINYLTYNYTQINTQEPLTLLTLPEIDIKPIFEQHFNSLNKPDNNNNQES